nr:unnamed protein product [Callosobruchus analis]
MSESEIRALNIKRGTLKAQITRFKNFLSTFDEYESEVEELESRLADLNTIFRSFDDIQGQIEYLNPNENNETERENFENTYYKVNAEAKKLISRLRRDDIALEAGHFTSLIHNDRSLDNVEKFFYLRSCLKGEAAQLIQSLKTTEINYEVAWNLLRETYENKRLIVDNHIKALFELSPVKTESHTYLRKLINNFNKNLNAIEVLIDSQELCHRLLIHLLVNKLDSVTRNKYEEHAENLENLTVTDVIAFLTKRSNVLEKLYNKGNKPKTDRNFTREERVVCNVNTNSHNSCAFCGKGHSNFDCKNYNKLSVKEKYDLISKHRLCSNCLRPGHYQRDCRSSGCKKCNSRHHISLCRQASLVKDSECDNSMSNHNSNNLMTSSGGARQGSEARGNGDVRTLEQTTPVRADGQDRNRKSADDPICNNNSTRAVVTTTVHTGAVSSGVEGAQINGAKAGAVISAHTARHFNKVVLATTHVLVRDAHGNLVKCRALLDPGSMSNFVTKEFAKQLDLKITDVTIEVKGVNRTASQIFEKIEATISSIDHRYKIRENFYIIDKITNDLPITSFEKSLVKIPDGIKLADEHFNVSSPVQMLLGADVYYRAVRIGQIKESRNDPVISKTAFGWIIGGYISAIGKSQKAVSMLAIANEQLHQEIEKFWQIENIDEQRKFTAEELECQTHFEKTYTRDRTGRFVVALPFKENANQLGDTKNMAVQRFFNLEKRLDKNNEMKRMYIDFMREYERLGHMSEIDLISDVEEKKVYLPHHGVLRESSTTTKLRVVFDASAQSDTGLSLNNVLKVGPVLQRDLFSILLSFRKHNAVITADVEKMYRQILVTDADRNFQRIVWRENRDSELKHYRLNTVTYGTAPASFLAVRSLHQAANDFEDIYPAATNIIKQDFYMDDLISGSDTVEEVKRLRSEITKILNHACMPLRKWASNKSDVLEGMGASNKNFEIAGDKTSKILGLSWDADNDTFSYPTEIEPASRVTKRTVLSTVAKLFDPLGLLGPIVVKAKLIIQALWREGFNWDESISVELHTSWTNLLNDLSNIGEITIPRQVTQTKFVQIILHAFCDSSERAYGACVYVVTVNEQGERQSNLLCAKSRVAPLKTIALPKLELCGAVLLADLVQKVTEQIDIKFDKKYYWTDSMVALSWIKGNPSSWKTFVANRVSHIQEKTQKHEWRHIRSELNPADLLSRGTSLSMLKSSRLWWNGPEFLLSSEDKWPESKYAEPVEVPEKRKSVQLCFLSNSGLDNSILERYSSLSKLQRVVAYILRFANNSKNKSNTKRTGDLSREELDESIKVLIRKVQASSFPEEIHYLHNNKPLRKSSKLLSLSPFLDDERLLRVGGRLNKSMCDYGKRHPYILPSKHVFTTLVINQEHKKCLHAGVQTVLANIRTKFWPIHGKSAVRAILRKCVICFRARPSSETPIMGEIPTDRLIPGRPFLTIESILNSRPLTPISCDPKDYSALTPSHFLISDTMLAIPERYPEDTTPVNRLKMYERLQAITSHFWRRWSKEYLTTLQQRTKWRRNQSSRLKVGDLVVLREDDLPVQQWRLGRVCELHPGKDGVVRVVSVKTSSGVTKRGVVKVCALPIDRE